MKGWKTIILSIVVTIIGALEAFDWANIIPDKFEDFLLPIVGALFLYLRTITTTAVGKSE